MKWRHLGHSHFLSRVVSLFTVVAEMNVSSPEEMANPQGTNVLAVERHGVPEDFVSFRTLCGVQ